MLWRYARERKPGALEATVAHGEEGRFAFTASEHDGDLPAHVGMQRRHDGEQILHVTQAEPHHRIKRTVEHLVHDAGANFSHEQVHLEHEHIFHWQAVALNAACRVQPTLEVHERRLAINVPPYRPPPYRGNLSQGRILCCEQLSLGIRPDSALHELKCWKLVVPRRSRETADVYVNHMGVRVEHRGNFQRHVCPGHHHAVDRRSPRCQSARQYGHKMNSPLSRPAVLRQIHVRKNMVIDLLVVRHELQIVQLTAVRAEVVRVDRDPDSSRVDLTVVSRILRHAGGL
mmetsp:Transcript_25890/g.72223  ORF Transcript_25890/g.72223 Transcript_25890/m.72223 type:complete len:287 (-) Transcript_25890:131-991(-)